MFFVVLLLAILQGLPPLVGPLVPDSNGVVTGAVRHASTGRPLAEAQVAVVGDGESVEDAMTHATVTDQNGRFTIRGVIPGERVLVVQVEGFFELSTQIAASARVLRDVRVGDGQQTDAGIVQLIPGGAISGRLAAPDGQPAVGAIVQALRASYIQGQLTFTVVKSTHTDDRGEYRLFWLPAGEYYVRGQYRTASPDQTERYERMFFPGIAEEDAAPPIVVGSGSEVPGIDIRVRVAPIKGITVSGRVVLAAPEAAGISDWRVSAVQVVPRDRRVLLIGDDTDVFPNVARDALYGQFEIRNVPTGDYMLSFLLRDNKENVRTASVPLTVDATDIENISAVVEPEVELRGRLTWDGFVQGNRLGRQALVLTPLEVSPWIQEKPIVINPDVETGEFLVPHLAPGNYTVQLTSSFRPLDAYIGDVQRSGTSVVDTGFEIGGGTSEPLEVQLKSRGEIVAGTVIDRAKVRPFAHATVVLIPDGPRRQNFGLYKHVISAADGTFTFRGVPPGSYKLLALHAVTPGIWENPLFIRKYEDRNLTTSIVADSAWNVQLAIAP
jgi:hypothetical protein